MKGFSWVAALLLVVAVLGAPVFAAGTAVQLTDTGIDLAASITLLVGGLAGLMAAILGGYMAFLLMRRAMRWMGKALG